MIGFGSTKNLLAAAFVPHGTCYLWRPGLLGLHAASDAIIALSYFSIPIALVHIARKRPDIPFNWLFLLFAAFIVACGVEHLLDIWTLWHPDYWISGTARAITAIASLGTAYASAYFIPEIISLPSSAQMEEVNALLLEEIKERQQIEAKLQQEQQFLKALLENLSDGIIACNAEGELTLFNRATLALHGKPPASIPVEQWAQYYNLYRPDGKTPMDTEEIPLFRALQGETVRDAEIAIAPPNHPPRFFLASGAPIFTPEGEKLGAVVATKEVTQSRQAEANLREREEFLRSIYNGVDSSIFVVDVAPEGEFRFVGFNPTHEKLTGLPSREIAGKTPQQIFPPEAATATCQHYEDCLRAKEAIAYEVCLPFQGEPTWWLISLNPLFRDDGQIYRLIGTGLNITQRKQAEAALRESDRRFRAIFNSTFQFIGLLQPDGTMLEVNQTALDFAGLQGEDVIDRLFWEAPWWGEVGETHSAKGKLSPKRERVKEAIARAGRGEFVRYEVDVLGAGNAAVTIDFSLQPVFNDRGEVVLLIPEGRDITEKKRAEAALKISEERWQLALIGTGDGIFDWNIATGEVFLSPVLKQMLGYSDSEVENSLEGWKRLLHPDDRHYVLDYLQAHLRREIPRYAIEYRLRCKNGSYKWILARGETKRNGVGEPLRMVGSHQDISDRKAAEAALGESQKRLKLALNASGNALWDWDIPAGKIYVSPHWFQMLGYRPDEFTVTVETWGAMVHPEDRPWVTELLEATLEDSSVPYHFEYRLRAKSGEWKWLGNCGQVVARAPDGRPLRMAGTHKDISDRKAAEAQLFESLERYQLLAENSSDLIATQTLDGVYLYVSPTCRSLLGYEPEDLIGRSFYEFLHPEDAVALQKTRGLISQFPEEYTYSYRMRRRDGHYVWLETTHKMSSAPDYNHLQVVVSIARNITERKQVEAALTALNQELEQELSDRRSKLKAISRLYRSVVNSVKEVIFQTDKSGRWIFLSPAWSEISGFTVDESLNTPLLDYVYSPKEQQRMTLLFQDLIALRRESFRCEFRCPTKSGGFRWLEIYANVEQQDDGTLVGTYGTLNDITERKQAEAILKARADELTKQQQQIHLQNLQLQEASRLKSEFLATMSHELRTPLNAIMGFSQMLQLQHYGALAPRQKDMVDRIFNNSQNLLEMLNEVLDFSKIEAGGFQLQPEQLEIDTLVRLAIEELRSLAQRKNLDLEIRCWARNPRIFNDRSGVRRILANLLSNAIKFTETGKVTVEVEDIEENAIALTIKDTGIGISPEDIGTIFDAFRQVDQTLTRQHAGTGLGLAITQSLVKMMQGRISVESEVGIGTAFRVELPRRVEV
ncbi:MAG: PAS domain S-box protein [Cyanobacteriota bacterium]|nr:PAS domain S-box protein [Cyanobacteriota bacterium]